MMKKKHLPLHVVLTAPRAQDREEEEEADGAQLKQLQVGQRHGWSGWEKKRDEEERDHRYTVLKRCGFTKAVSFEGSVAKDAEKHLQDH